MTRYLAVAFLFVATATAQNDFWPPFQVLLRRNTSIFNSNFEKVFQEEWRCLGEDDGGYYDWVDDTPAWVEETHHLITYVDNPEGQAALDFDCPVIDPTDTATWCPQGIDYYPVPCEYIQMYSNVFSKELHLQLVVQQKAKKKIVHRRSVQNFSLES